LEVFTLLLKPFSLGTLFLSLLFKLVLQSFQEVRAIL
jgi:hypothetical protein